MRPIVNSFSARRHITALGLVISAISLNSPALALPLVSNGVKSGLARAIERADSGSWLGSPTVEQRIEAGLVFLRSEGYYGASIEVAEENALLPNSQTGGFWVKIPDDSRQLFVNSGNQFTIVITGLIFQGQNSQALDTAKKSAAHIAAALNREPARASDVLRVQSQVLAAVKEVGFTQAVDSYPEILVDHATNTMSITYNVSPGLLRNLGEVLVTGASATPQSWVSRTAAVTRGDVALGKRLRKIEERFRSTGAYQNVDLLLTPVQASDAGNGTADLALTLVERTKRTWSAGAAWSTSDGLGIDASTSFFHRFHQADTLTLEGRIGTLESSLGANLRLPSFRGPSRDLFLDAKAGQETTDAFTRLIAQLGATYVLPRGRTDLLTYGLSLDVTRTRTPPQLQFGLNTRDVDGADLSFLMRYERDRTDDIINPTTGWRALGEVQPSVFAGESQTIPYGRLVFAGSVYRPFNGLKNGVIAARLKAGILVTSNERLPFDRRFFAGGGGSVRGYAYQSIGPRDTNDNPLGGRSIIEGSLEARWSLSGPFGLALFVDGARVTSFENASSQQTKFGVGAGLRYNLGIAPLRIDLAVPLNKRDGDPPVQIYLSAGQSF